MFTPSDLARLALALALVVGIFAAGLVLAVLFTPVPLTDAVPWWAPPLGGVVTVAVMIGVDARRRR